MIFITALSPVVALPAPVAVRGKISRLEEKLPLVPEPVAVRIALRKDTVEDVPAPAPVAVLGRTSRLITVPVPPVPADAEPVRILITNRDAVLVPVALLDAIRTLTATAVVELEPVPEPVAVRSIADWS